jgi:hypothetical protein
MAGRGLTQREYIVHRRVHPSLLSMTIFAGLVTTEAAQARCVNTTTGGQATDGIDMPSSNQSVVCSPSAPNPSTTTVSSTPGSTGVTITVMPGATVSTTARAIGLDGNASSIFNQGTVQTSGFNAFGLSVLPGRNGDTITNAGIVTTTGSRGHGLDARGSNSTIINQGTVSVSGAGASGIRSIETTTGTLITNSGAARSRRAAAAVPRRRRRFPPMACRCWRERFRTSPAAPCRAHRHSVCSAATATLP